MTVLVVDDEQDYRDSVRDALQDEGYRVLVAGTGMEALHLLEGAEPVRLILLDLFMPEMSGGDLLRMLRRRGPLAEIPVIIVTSDPSRAPDGVRTLRKPFHLEALLDEVRSTCHA